MKYLVICLILASCVSEPHNIITQHAVIDSVYTERKPSGTPPLFYKDQWHIRANGHWAISPTPRAVGDTNSQNELILNAIQEFNQNYTLINE